MFYLERRLFKLFDQNFEGSLADEPLLRVGPAMAVCEIQRPSCR